MRGSRIVMAAASLAILAGCGAVVGGRDAFGAGLERETMRPLPDLAPTISGPLTLEQCIEIALERSPRIGQYHWRAEGAAAQCEVVAAARWPSVDFAASYHHHVDDQRLIPATEPGGVGVWSSDILAADLVISMPIYTGGRIVNEMRASELLRLAAAKRLARARGEVVFNVSSAFYSIQGQRRVIASLEFSRTTLEEHRKRVGELMAAQKATRVDLLRTEVRLADIDQRLLGARNSLAIQRQVLSTLMGLSSDSPVDVSGDLALDPFEPEEMPVERALARRDDYLAARAEVEAQRKRVAVEAARRLPTLSLVGSYGGRWAVGDVTEQTGASASEDIGSLGLSFSVPIADGGRARATLRREQADLRVAEERLRELELRIRLEVQTAVLNLASSLKRVRATEKSIEQARESLRIEREKYELGKGSITDVLDAQGALLEAETSNVQAIVEHNTAVEQYRLAVGEGR